MGDVFSFESGTVPASARVMGFRGIEAISKPYRFDICFQLPVEEAQNFDLAGAIGSDATLKLRRDSDAESAIHGVLSSVELIHAAADRALYRAILGPRFARLGLARHSRIFTEVSVPEVLEKVLLAEGLAPKDFSIELKGSYPVEEHITQYRESSFAFLSRWMEHEGLYYFFDHGDVREKLVITDDKSFARESRAASVRYYPSPQGDRSAGEALETFTCRHSSVPAKVKLQDYDYNNPALDVSGSASVAANGFGEVVDHGARFVSPDAGKRYAKIRAEEIMARQVVYKATGTVQHLRAGTLFSLEEHPLVTFNTRYLVTEIEHFGQTLIDRELQRHLGFASNDVYRCELVASTEDVQYRAERKTGWPRIYGVEHGVIDGEHDSEYAQIDDHGRYRAKLNFDESDLGGGKASQWVRMLQPHGGDVEGWHFPLRKGTEVMFTFLGGDPDRPVITGVAPNAKNPSPVTSKNNTTNIMKTGGGNLFELEDKKGSERITLSTPMMNTFIKLGAPNSPYNLTTKTDGKALHECKERWDILVGNDMTEKVVGKVVSNYLATEETNIDKGRKLKIAAGGEDRNITGDCVEVIVGNYLQRVTEVFKSESLDIDETVRENKKEVIGGNWQTTVVKTWEWNVLQDWNANIVQEWNVNVGKKIDIDCKGDIVIKSPTKIKIECPETHFKSSTFSLETYESKNAFGLQKAEACGVSFATTALKFEATGMSTSAVATKMEKAGIAVSIVAQKGDFVAQKLKVEAAEIAQVGTSLLTGLTMVTTSALIKT